MTRGLNYIIIILIFIWSDARLSDAMGMYDYILTIIANWSSVKFNIPFRCISLLTGSYYTESIDKKRKHRYCLPKAKPILPPQYLRRGGASRIVTCMLSVFSQSQCFCEK